MQSVNHTPKAAKPKKIARFISGQMVAAHIAREFMASPLAVGIYGQYEDLYRSAIIDIDNQFRRNPGRSLHREVTEIFRRIAKVASQAALDNLDALPVKQNFYLAMAHLFISLAGPRQREKYAVSAATKFSNALLDGCEVDGSVRAVQMQLLAEIPSEWRDHLYKNLDRAAIFRRHKATRRKNQGVA
jgi:hypothetical protein